MNKRDFLRTTVAVGVAAAVARPSAAEESPAQLQDMTSHAVPISVAERESRVAKAQRRLQAAGIDALLLDAGSALVYFTGIRWWRSERFTGAIIPAEGEIAVVTPYFEEPSIRESLAFGDDIRTWHEHENPFALINGLLKDRGLKQGKIAIEETVRHFIVDGLQQAAPDFEVVSGKTITRACRMIKSPAEIALMQIAKPESSPGTVGSLQPKALACLASSRVIGGPPNVPRESMLVMMASLLRNMGWPDPRAQSSQALIRNLSGVLL